MGAAASIEGERPGDGSDLPDLNSAREEIIRLRNKLGIQSICFFFVVFDLLVFVLLVLLRSGGPEGWILY